MKFSVTIPLAAVAAMAVFADTKTPGISGDYIEVRSCDVYTGPCFANGEMGLAGKEGMLFWSVREGSWNGARLDGLGVMAVVRTDATMGDLNYQPLTGKTVLIVDAKANARQREALADFARSMSGGLIGDIVNVTAAPIEASIAACGNSGCASVTAGTIASISTSCLGNLHHVCGNESVFYPPLTQVNGAYPALTDLAVFKGEGLNMTWQIAETRSAFLATFSAASGSGTPLASAR